MSIADVAARQSALIRKAQDAVICIGTANADPIEAITETESKTLVTLPTGWGSLGRHTKDDGINWTRDVETGDTTSHGSPEPTRRDITSDVTGLTVIAQESNMQTWQLYHNVDLSSVTPDPTTGEIAFNRARTPATRYYRLLALAQDGAGEDLIYFARFCPRASVTEYDEQGWVEENELRYSLTFTAYVDDTLGYAMREMWAGPGLASLYSSMGFTAPAA